MAGMLMGEVVMARRQWSRIDVDAVLRQRVPSWRRLMPHALVRVLERAVCQDELNAILEHGAGLEGAAFCRSVLDYLDVRVDVEGAVPGGDARVTYVSNHPLGGLDGMALIALVTEWHGGVEPLFPVNDLLMAVEPLRRVFVPVNKHGRQSRQTLRAMEEAFASERPVVMFPAGLVSRRGADGVVRDLEWKRSYLSYSAANGRRVVPLGFVGENSGLFYRLAEWRKRLGVRFNLEMLRLPREVVLSRGKRFTVRVGAAVEPCALGPEIRGMVDALAGVGG